MDFYIRVQVGTNPFFLPVTQDEFNAFIELVREEFYVEVIEKPGEYDNGTYFRYSTCGDNKYYLGFIYKRQED